MMRPVVRMGGGHVRTVMIHGHGIVLERHRRPGVVLPQIRRQSLRSLQQAILQTAVQAAEQITLKTETSIV